MASKFIYTTAIRKLRRLKKRIRVVPGGTSAGKTYGILPLLIQRATKEAGLEISVVSESVPHLRKGALKDFLAIMKSTGRYIDAHYNKTLLTYTFHNGSYIEFFSADQEGKVRGPRRNILYINECNNLSFETYHQLAIRTDLEIWLDYNPSAEFWVDTELKNDPDADWLTLTYKDNEALSQSIIKEIEKALHKGFYNGYLGIPRLFDKSNIKNAFWANWWKVYGLGLTGALQGVVFSNWQIIDNLPGDAELLGSGMDFGFTNDPTTNIAAYKSPVLGRIFDQRFFEKGLTSPDIAARLKDFNVAKRELIVADSADPKTIKEVSQYGYNITGAKKGPDSIMFGINILQEEPFYVTAGSVDLIKELRNYTWAEDRDGNKLNKPIDAWNHGIDPMRYIAVEKFAQTGRKRGKVRRTKIGR